MVRKAGSRDVDALAELAAALWDACAEELANEFSQLISTGKAQFFLKLEGDIPIGFAQCQLRYDYVEGTQSSPVGYLEGILIQDDHRRRGYATELLAACEAWAREKGCVEFASDCELDNIDSLLFHQAVGFTETNRVICFTKAL